MQRNIRVPGNMPFLLFGSGMALNRIERWSRWSELDQHRRAPFLNHPVWSFEVCFSAEKADGVKVFGGKEEGVGELVFIWEEGGGKSEVGVEGAGGGGGEEVGGEIEAKGGVETYWGGEGGKKG